MSNYGWPEESNDEVIAGLIKARNTLEAECHREHDKNVGLTDRIRELEARDHCPCEDCKRARASESETVLKRAKLMLPHWPREHVLRTKWGKKYTDDGFRAMWQRYCRIWEKAGNERFHFHDLRAKSISDNESLDEAYLLAGHIDIKMTRRVYDRNRRRVNPLR